MRKRVSMLLAAGLAVATMGAGMRIAAAQDRPGAGRGTPGMRPGFGGPGSAQMFGGMDKNSDGKITKSEAADTIWERFSQADENGDGTITRKEFESVRVPMGMRGPGRGGQPAQRGPGRGGQPGSRRGGGGSTAIAFESSPMPKNDAEKKILAVLAEMNSNERRGNMNVPEIDGRLLRLLTETVGAKHVVEIGTSNGYSGIWFCLALRKTGGKLTTHEIDAGRAKLARQNFKRAAVDKLVTLVEGDAHEEVKKIKGQIDVLFLDADKEGYIDYLEKLVPLVRPGGLILAHNINQRQADARFVKAITTNADLETLFLHMQGSGVSVTMKKR